LTNRNIIDSYIWVEKYRPRELSEIILKDSVRNIFSKYIEEQEIPHLLFHGPPGSGKTTVAKILYSKIIDDKYDLLKIKGSVEGGVETMRNNVEDFLKSPCFGGSKIKIVFIDEADGLTEAAQKALRNMIEEYYKTGRFIFTVNYLNKIIDPILSRFQSFEFSRLPENYILNFCKKILDNEKIKYNDNSILRVISNYYPDVRRIINTIQSKVENNSFVITDEELETTERKFKNIFLDLIHGIFTRDNLKINTVLKEFTDLFANYSDIDYNTLYRDLFNDPKIPVWIKILICRYSNSHSSAMIPQMNLMAMCLEVIEMGKKQYQLLGK